MCKDFISQNDLDVDASFALNLGRLRKKIVMKSIEQRRQTSFLHSSLKLNLLLGFMSHMLQP